MTAQVEKLRHQEAPVIIALPQKVDGFFQRVVRRPGDGHEFIRAWPEGNFLDADAPFLSNGGDAGMRFPLARRRIRGEEFAMREFASGDPLNNSVTQKTTLASVKGKIDHG